MTLHLRGNLPRRDGSGDICGTVYVMTAGVHQQKRVFLQVCIGLFRRTVMHDGPVRSCRYDGVEALPYISFHLFSDGYKLFCHIDLREACYIIMMF